MAGGHRQRRKRARHEWGWFFAYIGNGAAEVSGKQSWRRISSRLEAFFSQMNPHWATSNVEYPIEIPLPAEGLEPTRPCGHWILSPARLPIPPRRQISYSM